MQVPGSATVVMQPAFALSGTQTVGAGGDGYAVGDILIPTTSTDVILSTSTTTSTSAPIYTTETATETNVSTSTVLTTTSTEVTTSTVTQTSTSTSVDVFDITTDTSTDVSTSTTIYRPGTTATGASSATIKVVSITGTDTRGPIDKIDFNGPGPYTDLPTTTMAVTPLTGTGTGARVIPRWTTVNPGAYPSPVLSFTVQPTDVATDTPISPAVQVAAVGNLGIPVDTYIGSITLAIGNNPGSPAGALSGTVTQAAVAGVAAFSDLQINHGGDGYTLVASAGNLVNKTSASFNVAGDKATGGTITTSGAYTIHTFTASGTFTTLVDNLIVDYLIVGGGGGGFIGAGGGGEVSYVTAYDMGSASANSVTVGNGGDYANLYPAQEVPGGSTIFVTTAVGGGTGGYYIGSDGACGSGGARDGGSGQAGGIGSVGYNGGAAVTWDDGDGPYTDAGGGGGMGAAGSNGSGTGIGGAGGDGVQNSISGSAIWYGGGGGGLTDFNGSQGTPGQGSGWSSLDPIGSPGGGASGRGSQPVGNAGIVIIRYLT